MTNIQDLITRLLEAKGPDRALDAEIAAALRIGPKPNTRVGDISWIDRNFPVWHGRPDGNVEVVHDNGTGGVNWKLPKEEIRRRAGRFPVNPQPPRG